MNKTEKCFHCFHMSFRTVSANDLSSQHTPVVRIRATCSRNRLCASLRFELCYLNEEKDSATANTTNRRHFFRRTWTRYWRLRKRRQSKVTTVYTMQFIHQHMHMPDTATCAISSARTRVCSSELPMLAQCTGVSATYTSREVACADIIVQGCANLAGSTVCCLRQNCVTCRHLPAQWCTSAATLAGPAHAHMLGEWRRYGGAVAKALWSLRNRIRFATTLTHCKPQRCRLVHGLN